MEKLKKRILFNNKFYGVYGEDSNFKCIKYLPDSYIPNDREYYKIGDIVLVLNYNYSTTVDSYIVADKDVLINVHNGLGAPDYIYLIGIDSYYYLTEDHPLKIDSLKCEIVTDYKSAYEEALKELNELKKKVKNNG